MVRAREREEVIVEIAVRIDLTKALAANKNSVTIISNGRRDIVSRDPFDPVSDDDRGDFRAAQRAAASAFIPEEGERL